MMVAMEESMKDMHQAKQIGQPDFDFASMMIPHHKGAVAMAEAMLKDSKSPVLIAFAREVIAAQNKEIEAFEQFLSTADQQPSKNAAQFTERLMGAMDVMMRGMTNWKSSGLDQDFISLMIPHHQSAVDMAKAYLPYAKNAKIKKMAIDIISAQEKEIAWLTSQIH